MIIRHHIFIINALSELKNFLKCSLTKLRDKCMWGDVEAAIPIKKIYTP